MEKIISVTDLVRNATRIADEIEAGAVYRVTRGGRGSMVLMSDEDYEGWMATIDLMRRPNWRAEWEQASRDIAAGRGKSLDEVVKELGLEDSPHPERRKPARRTARPSPTKSRASATRTRSRSA